ncbi:MAG: hypothetical protein JJU41_03520 [Bacteroidetes bacterium]|nr:hypothetical protein [Bacteroidota bacterium]
MQKKTIQYLIILLSITTIISACNEENPVNVLPDEVAGNYVFTEFRFVPDAAAIQPADILDTLVTANTYLRLIAGGQFILNYQFIGSNEAIISGDFSISLDNIRLRAAPGSEARLVSLLLNSPLDLKRVFDNGEEDSFEASVQKTVDLESYSSRYAGVPPVRGTLRLRLVRATN